MKNDTSDHELSPLRDLEKRVEQLEIQFRSLAEAYSRARHQSRRRWLRPPLWIFEQYSPRPLTLDASYALAQVPAPPPSVSIVTPSFNHGRFLKATIDSVLSQNYPRLSYNVQDGGSEDGTVELLTDYDARLAWRSERDSGQAHAINRGFVGVDCEIMAYLNSDDVLLPGTLAYVARTFADMPDVDLVYGNRIFIDANGKEIGRAVLPKHDARALYWASYVPQETLFWRRRVWDAIAPFDESFHYALDWDFTLRAQAAGFKFLHLPRFLACFRVHDEQKTSKSYDVGWKEMQQLRTRYLGHEPSHKEIMRKLLPYLSRQFILHWMYRCGILRL
jgi:glycosyltransferase involved in cell wall biosynthesis